MSEERYYDPNTGLWWPVGVKPHTRPSADVGRAVVPMNHGQRKAWLAQYEKRKHDVGRYGIPAEVHRQAARLYFAESDYHFRWMLFGMGLVVVGSLLRLVVAFTV